MNLCERDSILIVFKGRSNSQCDSPGTAWLLVNQIAPSLCVPYVNEIPEIKTQAVKDESQKARSLIHVLNTQLSRTKILSM